MNQEWFEMHDIRRKSFDKSVWLPLRANLTKEEKGTYGYEGYLEDFFGSGSIAIPKDKIEDAKNLDWIDIGISHNHSGIVDDGEYIPAEVYRDHKHEFEGIHLVLDQISQDESPNIWHLHQDLVVTLGLTREGNSWICANDGYVEVARLVVSEDGKPILLEIKSQYLKDYLCARGMALYMTHYFNRDTIISDASHIIWENGNASDKNDSDRWQGQISEIHEGGNPFGGKMAVFHVARTDVDETDDVPDISTIPTDENTHSESWEKEFEGRKLYRVSGELWRNEIILPSAASPKVRGDETKPTTFFVVDAEGKKLSGRDLIGSGKWLWFKPEAIMTLCNRKGGSLSFYTAQTGSVSSSYNCGVHFGINELGLINVYAKDIGLLPEWQQQIWAGYNITPEGGVSKELLASQVKAEPANSQAPESFLAKGIEHINQLAMEKLNIQIFREHEAIPQLIEKTHRFRAVDEQSLFALAKDLARLIADSLDAQAMQSIVSPPNKEKWGSLKSLENLLASKYERDLVRQITASLVGVYQLRHADAHLPSSEIEEAFKLIEIDRSAPFVFQGFQMLHRVVSSLFGIAECLEKWE